MKKYSLFFFALFILFFGVRNPVHAAYCPYETPPSGFYCGAGQIPAHDANCNWICVSTSGTACIDTDGGKNYPVSAILLGGGSSCSGGICRDSCYNGQSFGAVGWAVSEWYCQGDTAQRLTYNCPSGSCSGGACAPGVCSPVPVLPANGSTITTIPPTLTWTSCVGATHHQLKVTGGGIDWQSFPMTAKSYTMTGFTFTPGTTYTWKVRSCADSTCTTASPWVTSTFNTPAHTVTVIPSPTSPAFTDPSPTAVPSPTGPITQFPTATPFPTGAIDRANLLFKVLLPDVSNTVTVLPNVRVQVWRQGNALIDTKTILQRNPGTSFFTTATPLELDLQTGQYTVLVKQLKTIRRSFASVSLVRGQTLDCIKDTPDTSCGGLISAHLAPLYSGDSDGYNDGSNGTIRSDSFNRIDAADLQKIVSGYGSSSLPPEPNADFNVDGKIDIFDLGILGKNFGKQGE